VGGTEERRTSKHEEMKMIENACATNETDAAMNHHDDALRRTLEILGSRPRNKDGIVWIPHPNWVELISTLKVVATDPRQPIGRAAANLVKVLEK
jgi:hypothetical protein